MKRFDPVRARAGNAATAKVAFNRTREIAISEEVEVADTFCRRLVGLIGRRALERGRGLLLEPCGCIHTLFMRFSIDAVFLDAEGKVIGLEEEIPPFAARRRRGAVRVLELPAGAIRSSETSLGDRVEFR